MRSMRGERGSTRKRGVLDTVMIVSVGLALAAVRDLVLRLRRVVAARVARPLASAGAGWRWCAARVRRNGIARRGGRVTPSAVALSAAAGPPEGATRLRSRPADLGSLPSAAFDPARR